MSSQPALLTLPFEVIELVLISSRSPRTVASLAQTCRMLRTLVYASPDSHLWRELFLSIWDDPRPALQHRSLIDPRVAEYTRDWGVEYRRRVVADKWLKSWRSSVSTVCPYMPPASVLSNEAALLPTLRTLLDTFLTMTPFPASPTMSLTALTPNLEPVNAASTVGESRERMARAPPFPPLLLLLASGLDVIPPSRSGVRLGRIAYGPHASRAHTIADAHRPIPTPSLPPQLTRTLLGSLWTGAQLPFLRGIEIGTEDEVGEVFHHIVCITGFVPIPPPLCTAPAPSLASTTTSSIAPDQASLPGSSESSESDTVPPSGSQTQTNDFPTRAEQYAVARRLAKRRVYDMQYLRGDRMWGPYQVVERDVLDSDVAGGGEKGDDDGRRGGRKGVSVGGRASGGSAGSLGTLAWAMGMDVDEDASSTSSDDDDDEDWHDDEEHGDVWYPGERGEDNDGNDGDGEDEDDGLDGGEPVHADGENGEPNPTTSTETSTNVTTSTGTHTRTRTRRSNPRRPPSTLSPREIKPHHLKPDYVYLASVRIVAEANLRDVFKVVASEEEGGAGDVGENEGAMFWEDEDEILRTRTGGAAADASTRTDADAGVGIGTSGGSALAGVASYEVQGMPTGTSTAPHTETHTLELTDLLSAIRNVEVARVGGACGYWGGWIGKGGEGDSEKGGFAGGRRPPRVVTRRRELESVGGNGATVEGATSGRNGKGKGKQSVESAGLDSGFGDWEVGAEGDACEGWDWAGVTGLWRRCVSWMDYQDLLYFNLDRSKFLTLDSLEAHRIIPMELRITGYTRAGLVPIPEAKDTHNDTTKRNRPHTHMRTRYFRPPPIIHFTGSSIGSDRRLDDGRTVKGSVGLIGGGEVRWQMDTSVPGSSAPEWSSEAVQIGGVGSALGLLGIWTGARHQRADPLGPFWAWKVG